MGDLTPSPRRPLAQARRTATLAVSMPIPQRAVGASGAMPVGVAVRRG